MTGQHLCCTTTPEGRMMLGMAKRKTRPKAGDTPPRKAPQRSGKPLNVWLDAALRDAIDLLLTRTRRTLTTEVSIALEEHLKKAGLWPPLEAQEGAQGEGK